MEEEIHYKVVLSAGEENVFYSSFASGKALIVYKTNVWTKAPEFLARRGYHPMVFDKLSDVVDYSLKWSIVFKCLCRKNIKLPDFSCSLYFLSEGIVSKTPDVPWLKGTLMFEEIKLLERIPQEEVLDMMRQRRY